MNTKLIIVGLLALIVGGVAGYSIDGHRDRKGFQEKYGHGEHMMTDGTLMRNDASMDMTDMMAGMNDRLRDKRGDEFDKAFLAEMIIHHEGAVEMAELARTNASHQEIKNLAEAIITAQNKEIADMQEWQKNWYGAGVDSVQVE